MVLTKENISKSIVAGNKEVLREPRVHTKRNIAVRQDVYDYGTLSLLHVSIFTVPRSLSAFDVRLV